MAGTGPAGGALTDPAARAPKPLAPKACPVLGFIARPAKRNQAHRPARKALATSLLWVRSSAQVISLRSLHAGPRAMKGGPAATPRSPPGKVRSLGCPFPACSFYPE